MSKYTYIFFLVVSAILLDSTLFLGQSLTGIWQDNNGTRYEFRQMDNELYWRMDGRPRAINVFYGVITGKTITGEWVDLPGGQKMGSGTIAMEIIHDDLIRKTAQNGNYGASEWIRIPVFTQPIDEPISGSESSASNWTEIYSFGEPKVALGKLFPPPETRRPDRVLLDEIDEEIPKAELVISEISLEQNDRSSGKCHWPGTLMVTIKNVGKKAVDENDKTGLIGKISMIGFSEEKGAYERVNVDLRFGRGPRAWGRMKYGMKPLESKKISARFTGVEGFTVSQIGHFFVRVELTKRVWDEDAQKEKEIVTHSAVKEFKLSGFDLMIPRGAFFIFDLQKNKASLATAILNIGELDTPGNVGIKVIVPVKNRKNVLDNWVEFHHNFGKPLKAGDLVSLELEDLISLTHPERGKPDLPNMFVHAYSTCPNSGGDAFDKDLSNNYHYGKSRTSIKY